MTSTTPNEIFVQGNYKERLIEEVDYLTCDNDPTLTVEQRISNVIVLTDMYVKQTGKRPDVKQLDRLADYVLKDVLSNRHPDKITREEYPILSDGQAKRRGNRERSIGENIENIAFDSPRRIRRNRVNREND